MTVDDYLQMRPPRSRWRRRARETIVEVLDESSTGSPVDQKELLARVDDAYPFVGRSHSPYKAWLAERRLLIEALAGPVAEPILPTQDEADACEVARDMVLEGRLDEARALLEQAPNRLARRCPACGAKPGADCDEPVEAGTVRLRQEVARNAFDVRATMSQSHVRQPLLVPHVARLVGHRDAGPLFGGEP